MSNENVNKLLAKNILMGSSYWILNKNLVKILGLETTFFLSNLAEAESLFPSKDGWFFQTKDTMESMSGLSRHKQDTCIKQLKDLNLIKVELRGMPSRRWFKIEELEILNIMAKYEAENQSKNVVLQTM